MSVHEEASAYALLTDGATIEIRTARPDDFAAVPDMHARMSPDNLYLRFFSMSPMVAEQEARRICREPGPDHAAGQRGSWLRHLRASRRRIRVGGGRLHGRR